jgi:hypothetical protein
LSIGSSDKLKSQAIGDHQNAARIGDGGTDVAEMPAAATLQG